MKPGGVNEGMSNENEVVGGREGEEGGMMVDSRADKLKLVAQGTCKKD